MISNVRQTIMEEEQILVIVSVYNNRKIFRSMHSEHFETNLPQS